MTAILRSENGNIKEVPAINWLNKNAKELQDIYFDMSTGYLQVIVHVSKYRTFQTSHLDIDTVKELFEDSKFDHVGKHY